MNVVHNNLEHLLDQVTNPVRSNYENETIVEICKLINGEPNGTFVALRVLAKKIHSSQEEEALASLTVLGCLAKRCGPFFRSELGKFKFLNEMMKLVSEKHLGNQTTKAVKEKCCQLLFEWSQEFHESEPKFTEAFNMLRDRGLINCANIINPNLSNASRQQQPNIFERNAHSTRLTQLLQSRNPADIAEANRIIKTVVEEDNRRVERSTERLTEMEVLKNNSLLLSEMVSNMEQQVGTPSDAELDLMRELADNIRKSRPTLYKFALTHEDEDAEIFVDIAYLCDQASVSLSTYEEKLKLLSDAASPSNGAIDLLVHSEEKPPVSPHVNDLARLELEDIFSGAHAPTITPTSMSSSHSILKPDQSSVLHPVSVSSTSSCGNDLASLFSNLSTQKNVSPSNGAPSTLPTATLLSTGKIGNNNINTLPTLGGTATSGATSSPVKHDPFHGLDSLGLNLFGLGNLPNPEPLVPSNTHQSSPSLHTTRSEPDDTSQAFVEPTAITSTEWDKSDISEPLAPVSSADFSAIDVQLSAIKPHATRSEPWILYPMPDTNVDSDKTSLRLVLYYTGNCPAHDVSVFVAVLTNHSPQTVTDIYVRFAVDKPLRIRQLAATGQSLPAHSPFIPSGTIQQIVLLSDPVHKPNFTLQFQLSCYLDGDIFLTSGSSDVPSS